MYWWFVKLVNFFFLGGGGYINLTWKVWMFFYSFIQSSSFLGDFLSPKMATTMLPFKKRKKRKCKKKLIKVGFEILLHFTYLFILLKIQIFHKFGCFSSKWYNIWIWTKWKSTKIWDLFSIKCYAPADWS